MITFEVFWDALELICCEVFKETFSCEFLNKHFEVFQNTVKHTPNRSVPNALEYYIKNIHLFFWVRPTLSHVLYF